MKRVNLNKPIIFPRHVKSSLEIKTGDWRTFKPEFRTKSSACQIACPIGNSIRDCFQLAKDGKFEEAWQILIETNPLPAVLGRVCPHPCESKCLRGEFDEAIAINAFERYLGDLALEKGWRLSLPSRSMPATRRIAIVGAGPAGLVAAYQLRRLGYRIDIFEAEKVVGGMLYLGIPEYRLPKKLLIQEIGNNILSLGGIEIYYGVVADNLLWHHFPSGFDAVLIAIGRNKSRRLNIPGEENPQIISGLDFLKKINLDRKADIGAIVAVVGGGNTAIDAGRSAKRNGAEHVFILYRRREEDMPAFKEEIEAAKKEGIEIMPLINPGLVEKRRDGILRIECFRMKLGEMDETGRPRPVPIPGSLFAVFAHNLIVAVGEEPNLSFVTEFRDRQLPAENVFIAGDASSKEGGLVAMAIGSANRTVQEIDTYLKTGERRSISCVPEKIVQFSDLNLEYFHYMRSGLRRYPAKLSETTQIFMQDEAGRCFSCGDCNSCGNCWLFCPDLAVRETEEGKPACNVARSTAGRYEINYDYCKGCGICANECPRNAIDMKKEVKL